MEKKDWKKISFLMIGVVMAGIYPLVFLWTANAAMIVQVGGILMTLAGLAAAAAGAFLLLVWIGKKPSSAALASFVLILLFENGAFLHEAMVWAVPRLRYWHTAALLAVFGGAAAYLMFKLKETAADTVALVVSLMFTALVCFNAIGAIPAAISAQSASAPSDGKTPQGEGETAGRNIYWLLFDEYSSDYVFQKYFDYDNSAFTGALEEMGFDISRTSVNECNKTAVITANIANLGYVAAYSDDRTAQEDWALVLEARKTGVIVPMAESHGYEVVGIGSADYYGYTGEPVAAKSDSGVTMDGENVPVLFWKQTILFPFTTIDADVQAKTILSQLRYLQDPENIPKGNTFVLSHINSPHTPFLFDRDGKLLPANVSRDAAYYIGQCQFLNGEILKIVRTIVENDPEAMIAVISDHGRRGGVPYDDDRRIYAALYDAGNEVDIEGLSGMNIMIEMLNGVFGTDIEHVEPIVLEEVSH